MDYGVLEPHLRDLKGDLRRALDDKAKIDSHVAHLERAIEGIEGLIGPQPEPETLPLGRGESEEPAAGSNGKLMGTPAIRRVLAEGGDRAWKAKEIYAALDQRGWLSPKAAHHLRGVEAAVNRMWRSGELERVSPGRYRVKPASENGSEPNPFLKRPKNEAGEALSTATQPQEGT